MRGVLTWVVLVIASTPGWGEARFSNPAVLNPNANLDAGNDSSIAVATDESGRWITMWVSNDSLEGTIESDYDILYSISDDNGVQWTRPAPIRSDAANDTDGDFAGAIATDGVTTWIAVWELQPEGERSEIAVSRSSDRGTTWSDHELLNSNVADVGHNTGPSIASGGEGRWVAAWVSDERGAVVSYSHDDGLSWSPLIQLDPDFPYVGDFIAVAYSRQVFLVAWSSTNDLEQTVGGDPDILYSRSTDGGVSWSAPAALNADSAGDSIEDFDPHLASDRHGGWVATWTKGGYDWIYWDYGTTQVARSTDDGLSWEDPIALNPKTDGFHWDWAADVTTDGAGNWIVVWMTNDWVDSLGFDFDLLFSDSNDGGRSWSEAATVNSNAEYDSGDDYRPTIVSDRAGSWLVGWSAARFDGSPETDLLRAALCGVFNATVSYGELLFAPRCSTSAAGLEESVYDVHRIAVSRGQLDAYYLSSSGTRFAPLAADDRLLIDGIDSGLGPYAHHNGVPPYVNDVPIEHNLVMSPSHDVTALIPANPGQLTIELRDDDRLIYGNTAVYLVRDCGIYAESSPTMEWRFVSRDPPVAEFDMVSGELSMLRANGGFEDASCLGRFSGLARDPQSDPAPGTGRYFLAAGREGCDAVGFGQSSSEPDARLDLLDVCLD